MTPRSPVTASDGTSFVTAPATLSPVFTSPAGTDPSPVQVFPHIPSWFISTLRRCTIVLVAKASCRPCPCLSACMMSNTVLDRLQCRATKAGMSQSAKFQLDCVKPLSRAHMQENICLAIRSYGIGMHLQSPTSSVYSPRPEPAQQRDVDSMDSMQETRMLPSPMEPHSELVPPPPPQRLMSDSAGRAAPPRPRGRGLESHRLAADFTE